jgi:tetratricopeptide (TPR) repeat protein
MQMPSHTSRGSSSQDNKPFDLTDIFIGREQQLDLFEVYLNRWKQLMLHARSDDPLTMSAPSPNNKIQGLVVLIYGRGGIGKSSLLRHYRDIALRDSQNPGMSRTLISTSVDWEFDVTGKRGLFNLLQGQEIDAFAYFKLLCNQLAIALKNKPIKEFRKYHEAVKVVEKARKEASEVLGNMQRDERYAKLRNISVDVLTLLSIVVPPPINKVLENDKVKEAASEGMEIAAELLTQVKHKLQERLGSRLDDLLDPALRLGQALGRDLYEFARDSPLLIFFDTYEEVDEGDQLLRIVMGAAGPRVGWVIAGRDNLWAGVGQRERWMDIEYGYKDIVLSDRGLPVNLDASDAGAFTLSIIHQYFILLRSKVQQELLLPEVTEEGANRIWNVTQGVPLAVKIAAGLYLETASLDTITEDVQGKREIVDQMVRRYLLHTRADQAEQAKLYGLALLRRANQPAAIAAALGLTTQADYRSELSRLNRRYSFIFTEKVEPSLHEDVRHFLRLWLLEHRTHPEIMAVNERLKEAHVTSLQKLEENRNYSTLKERLQDDEWVGVYLDLTEQQFWLDPVEGVRYILPFLITASLYRATSFTFSMYRYNLDEDVVELGQFFETSIQPPYRDWWQLAIRSLNYRSNPFASNPWAPTPQGIPNWNDLTNPFTVPKESTTSQLEELAKLVDQRRLTFPQPLPDYKAELEALLWWHLGEDWRYQDEEKARGWYEKALTRLRQEPELRKAVASLYRDISNKFYDEKKYSESIPPLNRAIELDPYHVIAYNDRGAAYSFLGQDERALEDYNRAIELDPNNVRAHTGRGISYLSLKDIEQAKADFDRAVELDPAYIRAAWMRCWAGMSKQRNDRALIEQLEKMATSDLKPDDLNHYLRDVCQAVILSLRGKPKQGLAIVGRTKSLWGEQWNIYFWKGMICAYYYQGRYSLAREAIEKALALKMPPLLLTPLYWLAEDKPDFFQQYAKPLLEEYGV